MMADFRDDDDDVGAGSDVGHSFFSSPEVSDGRQMWRQRYFPLLALIAVCAFIGIGTPFIWSTIWRPTIDSKIEADLRFDCSPLKPEPPTTECQRPCLWDNYSRPEQISCYYPLERDMDVREEHFLMPRYSVTNNGTAGNGHGGDNYHLTMRIVPPFIHDANNEYLNKEPVLIRDLTLTVRHYTSHHVSVLIRPANEPDDLWSRHLDYNYPPINDSLGDSTEAVVTITDDQITDLFRLKIQRRQTAATIFDMSSHTPFVFANGYIEITTLLVNDLLYGLGQSSQPFRHTFTNPREWHLLSQYQTNLTENATSLFGSHPFYMGIDDPGTGNAYGVFLLNTFPIQAVTNSRPSLTLRTTGGHLEFHFFLGPKPADVVRQLQQFVHRPAMPPYWALGFHVCRARCSAPTVPYPLPDGIPLESDCGTSLPINAAEMARFVADLRQKNPHRKWIRATRPHLSPALDSRWKDNVLRTQNDQPYRGKVLGCTDQDAVELQPAYYPDFFNPTTSTLHRSGQSSAGWPIPDGYLLDENTPVDGTNQNDSCPGMLARYRWNYRYFARFQAQNPCMDSKFSSGHHDGMPEGIVGPYMALHNLYGFKHSQTVFRNWNRPDRRPFLLSLSTFVGSGRYGGHISTPLNGTWPMLTYAVKQMLDLSLMGIPMTGFPVGGYKGDPRSEDLMRQWFQLASMQPFMFAHSGPGQEETPIIGALQEKIRSSVKTRYQILPYLYTLFYGAATNGDMVTQPLFFPFFTDKRTYKITGQYMLGSALMVSPALHGQNTSISVYFPPGRWYDFYSGHIAWNSDDGGIADVSIVNINIHMRGGQILVMQNADATTTEARRKHGFQILAAYDKGKSGTLATGMLYVDSGDDPMPVQTYLTVKMLAGFHNVTVTVHDHNGFCQTNRQRWLLNTQLESMKLFGIIDPPLRDLIHVHRSRKSNPDQLEPVFDIASIHDSKFGVMNVIFERPIDLCTGGMEHRIWYFNWTYQNWN